MRDFLTALGLALVIEGAAYALFPEFMRRLIGEVLAQPQARLRAAGLAGALGGFFLVWLARS